MGFWILTFLPALLALVWALRTFDWLVHVGGEELGAFLEGLAAAWTLRHLALGHGSWCMA